MAPAIPTPYYFAWALALFFGLASLLKWKRRRSEAIRRLNRGLRTYTASRQTAA
jgi:hypothetical protein